MNVSERDSAVIIETNASSRIPKDRESSPIDLLGNPAQYFLHARGRFDQTTPKAQSLMGAIWTYCAEMTGPLHKDVSLEVPSRRLIELGLVSNKAHRRIRNRVEKQEASTQALEKNTIKVERVEGEGRVVSYVITERYIRTAARYSMNSHGAQLDRFVVERTHLSMVPGLAGGKFGISTERHEDPIDDVFHALGDEWKRKKPVEEPYKPAAITNRTINTTLALLAEGRKRGSVQPV